MTEAEWLNSTDSSALLRWVAPRTTDRKLHYYAIACCRRISPLLPHPASLRGVDVLERFVENEATANDLSEINWKVEGAAFRIESFSRDPDEQVREWIQEAEATPPTTRIDLLNNPTYSPRNAHDLLTTAAYFVDAAVSPAPWERKMEEWSHMVESRSFQSVPFIHDIFGNPLRPVTFDPAWRTPTAVGLAQGMYDARDFTAMPILADALQDAGCEAADVLNHCRDAAQPHVRGCWVVDLVLGKS